jgi:hypothetical protein
VSMAVALGLCWRYARSFRDAVDVARHGSVALERISLGRRQTGEDECRSGLYRPDSIDLALDILFCNDYFNGFV